MKVLKTLLLFALLICYGKVTCQVPLEDFLGKKSFNLFEELSINNSFVKCGIITGKPKLIVGLEVIFENGLIYKVYFRKQWLEFEAMTCDSKKIRKQKINEIYVMRDIEILEHYIEP